MSTEGITISTTLTRVDVATEYNGFAESTRPTIAQDEIARGLRGGVTQWNKFGLRDNSTAAGGDQTVWSDTTNFSVMTTAGTFVVNYNNSTDGSGTTGALQILIDYLDENFNLQTAYHTLSTTGADTTAFSGLGINRAVVIASGTANQNTNEIKLTATTGGSTQAVIPSTYGVTQQCVLHLPIDTAGVIKFIKCSTYKLSGGGNPAVEFKLWSYNRLTETYYKFWSDLIDTQSDTHATFDDPTGIPVSGRDVLFLTMDTDTNNSVARGRFSLNLYSTL